MSSHLSYRVCHVGPRHSEDLDDIPYRFTIRLATLWLFLVYPRPKVDGGAGGDFTGCGDVIYFKRCLNSCLLREYRDAVVPLS